MNFEDKEQPKKAVYFFQQLGLLFSRNKQYKQALESNKIALELSKKLGEISEQLITQYREAVENYPDASALDYHRLGNLLRSQNNFDEAIDFMLKSIQLSPNFNQSYIWLQYTKITENQREKIINVYRQALIKEPKNEVIWGNLADLLIVNNPKEAINCYQKGAYLKAIKKNPNLENLTWPSRKEKGPDFIIIGAPKGGTTSLYEHIDSHPQVFLPHKKELDFFSRCYGHGVESYLAQFPTIADNPEYITGEATPYYLSYTGVPSKIHSLFPEVKLIVLLRNPVEQVISYHYHKVNSGIYQLTLEQAINEQLKPIDNLSEEEIMQLLIPENFGLMVCLYYYHLKRWMQYFPREQFLIIKSEDFFKNTRQYVQEVYKFLGLPEYELKEYRKVNIGYYPTISEETRQFLADYCRPHNQKLEEFLGMKFDWD
jgi:tetratricopeptide (TPR) repeat protein